MKTHSDEKKKRKTKSISTGLTVKGNKKRAEALLLKTREEFDPGDLPENAGMLVDEFLLKWLKDKSTAMSAKDYAGYAYAVKGNIIPYFKQNPITLPQLTPKEMERFFQHERTNDDASTDELIFYHEILTACLGYAVELRWISVNPAEAANPCCDEAPILFADFIREWLGHSDISTTSNIYTHLDFSSKVSSANAILPAFPKNVQVFASAQ